MISDLEERCIVSCMGWVDGGSLWIFDLASEQQQTVKLGDASYLSLHRGESGCFAVVHHFDDALLEVTAHRFAKPAEVVARARISGPSRKIEGDPGIWPDLPRHYVAFLKQPAWSDYALVTIEPGGLSLQTFDWFDDSYDKDYQGLGPATRIPGSDQIIVSVQRDSNPVVFDPAKRCAVGKIALAGNYGNPTLYFRRKAEELWADDYDTILKLEPKTWRIFQAERLQPPDGSINQFIGSFAFDSNESVCAVARPFSGDVIGLDPDTLRVRYRANLGQQPLEVAVMQDLRVVARDWQEGTLLTGTFESV